jgi:hypothetical protein
MLLVGGDPRPAVRLARRFHQRAVVRVRPREAVRFQLLLLLCHAQEHR